MTNRREIPGQDSFFAVAEDSGQAEVAGHLQPAAQEPEFLLSVPIVNRNIELQNALTFVQAANRDRYIMAADAARERRGRTHMNEYIADAVRKRMADSTDKARQAFARATGSFALADHYDMHEMKKAGALDRQLYSEFLEKYSGYRHRHEAQEYRQALIRSTINQQTMFNRWQGLRPHRPAPTAKGEVRPSREDQTLNTGLRLKAILDDPRAGFIPPTHREKNQVMTYLDYLDNPRYPFRINNQFLEVFSHLQIVRRKNQSVDSQRGPLSIVYEVGDYLANAVRSRQALEEVQLVVLESPNPNVTLADEKENIGLNLNHPGFTALIRYRDLTGLVETGLSPSGISPLKTVETRWAREGPGQRKRIEDVYTAANKSASMSKYINNSIESLTILESHSLIGPAIDDQMRRQDFMIAVLNSVVGSTDGMPRSAVSVLADAKSAAQEILEGLSAA